MRACPLCASEASSRYMAASAWNNFDRIELRTCSACRFVFSAKAEFSYDEFFAEPLAGSSKEDLVRIGRSEGLDKLVAEIAAKAGIGRGAKVLDFGSGVGLAALSFLDAGFNVVAVEESKKYLEEHKSLGIKSFRSIEAASAEQGSFDLVVMKDVLEHLPAPREIFAKVVGCVRPGGHLYIRVPNVIAYRFHWAVDTRSHVNHFTPARLLGICANNGLKKVDFIGVHDVSSRLGKIYNATFWPARNFLPLYHQISLLFKKI